MRKLWAKIVGLVGMAILLLPEIAAAAAGKASPVVIVSDTRFMSGWYRWWGQIYNDSHVSFTILTYATILFVGVSLGFITDFLMKKTGIDLTSRELKEH
jgi:hypothetical protein